MVGGGSAEAAVPGNHPVISTPGFVGRDRELSELEHALAGGPTVVLLGGEAGIGKSRLLEVFWATHAGSQHRSLVTYCPPFRQPHTLGALVDGVRNAVEDVGALGLSGLAGALRPLFPEWSDSLPPTLEPMEDASASRHRLFRALGELLGRLDITVLVVEDAHWADEATLEFLLFLVSGRPIDVNVVTTFRPEDVLANSLLRQLSARAAGGRGHVRLDLAPLDVAETAALVSSMLAGERLSAEFAEFVHQHTDGIPVAIEESIRVMYERAALIRRNGKWLRRDTSDIAIPPTLRDTTLERVGRLSSPAQQVLAAAAVLSVPAMESVVATVAAISTEATRSGLLDGIEAGLLREDERGRVAFRHVLASRAIYDAIPAPERRSMHFRSGVAIESGSPQPVAQLARHFRAAGTTDKWMEYGERAATQAMLSGDRRTAAAVLHELIVGADLPVATVARLAGKTPFDSLAGEAVGELVRVLGGVVDNETLTEQERGAARALLGTMHWFVGDFDAGRAALERALPDLDDDPVTRSQVMVTLAWPRDPNLPAERHLEWLRHAEASAGALAGVDAVRFLARRMTALLMLGEREGWSVAKLLPEEVDDPAQRPAVATGHLNAGDAALQWGRYVDAERWLSSAARLAERHGYLTTVGMVEVNRARLDWYRGDWDGLAQRVADLVVDEDLLAAGSGDKLLVAGLLNAANGATAQAEEQLRASLRSAQRSGATDYCVEPAAALARLWMADGRCADALDVTDAIAEVLVRKGIWLWATDLVPVRVDALTAAERVDEAARLVHAYADGLAGRVIPAAQAGLLLSRAIVSEARDEQVRAAAMYAEAAAAWRALPRPYDALLAEERRAGCLVAAGQTDAGVDALRDGFRELSKLGARGGADRVLRRLRELGVAVPRSRGGGRPSYGNELSPRELEVVGLVRDGQTNRQIAQTLVLSTQTVAGHVRSAMRKVGVSSRTALAVRGVELGIVDSKR